MTAALLVTAMMTTVTTVAALPHTKTGKGPAVVLVHGLGGDRHVWDEVAKKLAQTHTVIALDLPGHGEAAAPKTIDLDDVARAIAATVRAEKAAPAVIVGHSVGGTITGHVPLVDPTVARAIVIVDSGIGTLWTQRDVDEARAGMAKDREATLRAWFGSICKPSQVDKVLAGVRKVADETLMGYGAATTRQSVADGGKALALPVLLMATKLSLPDPKKRTEGLAKLGFANVKNLQLEYFEQSMHWPFWDEPQKFTTALERFLATVEK
jgi:pimeloyl-ACP methyl ester carboxylesterase